MLAFVIMFAIVGGIISGVLANDRNRNVIGWVVAGATFPLITALILIASPKLPPGGTMVGY